jgi:hypothetical protein
MGYKEGNKGKSAIGAIKPMRRFYMVFEGSVESFNELLVRSELFRFIIEIL